MDAQEQAHAEQWALENFAMMIRKSRNSRNRTIRLALGDIRSEEGRQRLREILQRDLSRNNRSLNDGVSNESGLKLKIHIDGIELDSETRQAIHNYLAEKSNLQKIFFFIGNHNNDSDLQLALEFLNIATSNNNFRFISFICFKQHGNGPSATFLKGSTMNGQNSTISPSTLTLTSGWIPQVLGYWMQDPTTRIKRLILNVDPNSGTPTEEEQVALAQELAKNQSVTHIDYQRGPTSLCGFTNVSEFFAFITQRNEFLQRLQQPAITNEENNNNNNNNNNQLISKEELLEKIIWHNSCSGYYKHEPTQELRILHFIVERHVGDLFA